MPQVVVGSIPKKIAYTYSKETEVFVGSTWDINLSYDEGKHKVKYEKEKVLPSFVSDIGEDQIKRAKKWAGGWNQKGKSTTVEMDNDPLSNIRVLSLEERGRGGRAYKVLIDKFYVDLREDVLMDAMLQVGIAPGGILHGEYLWAKVGGQVKLIRIGSELHKLITEFEVTKDTKPIGKKSLEVGGIYQNRKKDKAIFLGYVNTTLFELEDKTPYYGQSRASFNYKHKQIKKAMLFYEIRYGSLAKNIRSMRDKDSSFKYNIKRSHTYIEKVGDVEIDSASIISFLREKAQKEVKNKILEYTGYAPPEKGYARITDTSLEYTIQYHANHLNLYPFEVEEAKIFDVKKYLVFS